MVQQAGLRLFETLNSTGQKSGGRPNSLIEVVPVRHFVRHVLEKSHTLISLPQSKSLTLSIKLHLFQETISP